MNLRQLGKASAAGIALAIVFVLLTYSVARITGDPLTVSPPGATEPEQVTPVTSVVATVIGGLVGLAIAALSRHSKRAKRTFLIVCGIGLFLMTFSPFAQAEQTSTAVWLNVMHLAAAAPIIGLLATPLSDAAHQTTPTPA